MGFDKEPHYSPQWVWSRSVSESICGKRISSESTRAVPSRITEGTRSVARLRRSSVSQLTRMRLRGRMGPGGQDLAKSGWTRGARSTSSRRSKVRWCEDDRAGLRRSASEDENYQCCWNDPTVVRVGRHCSPLYETVDSTGELYVRFIDSIYCSSGFVCDICCPGTSFSALFSHSRIAQLGTMRWPDRHLF